MTVEWRMIIWIRGGIQVSATFDRYDKIIDLLDFLDCQ